MKRFLRKISLQLLLNTQWGQVNFEIALQISTYRKSRVQRHVSNLEIKFLRVYIYILISLELKIEMLL